MEPITGVESHGVFQGDQPDYRRTALDAGAVGHGLKDNLADLYLLVATKQLLTSLKV